MKSWWWLIIVSFLFVLTSCGFNTSSSSEGAGLDQKEEATPDSPPEITGFVMDQEEDRILVVAPTTPASEGGARAMWVSGIADDKWIGKQVEVWVQGSIKESYPEQAAAKSVSVLEMTEVDGAELKADEALSSAISELSTSDILSVKKLSFDSADDKWIVHFSNIGSGSGDLMKLVPDQR